MVQCRTLHSHERNNGSHQPCSARMGTPQLKGRAIVLTEMEHHSDIVPWQMLAEAFGNELRYVPVKTI